LPWAFDRQALDLIAQPVYAEACSHFEIDPRRLDIVQRILTETFALLWRERTLHLSRHAHHHALCRHFCALRNNSTGRDHGAMPDLRAIQHHGSDPDQAFVLDGATMQHRHVSHRHSIPNIQRE